MVSGRSAARATEYGLPLSSDSNCASSSACFSTRSASLFSRTPRPAAWIFLRHGPLSKAVRAAATALSTSAASASATLVMTSPVAGLRVGKVLPEAESTHLLLMSSLVAETFTVGSKTVVAVAIVKSSLVEPFWKRPPLAEGSNREKRVTVTSVNSSHLLIFCKHELLRNVRWGGGRAQAVRGQAVAARAKDLTAAASLSLTSKTV